jgi:hypothetical protein
MNTVIRLNDTATRGFGSIRLKTGSNTTATAGYQDWIVNAAGVVRVLPVVGAPVVGLPPMLQIAYFMDSPAAVLKTTVGQVAFTQFYGKIRGKTEGCKGSYWTGCYSVVTLASHDEGASWQFRSAINWDPKRMPTDAQGPCEPSLVVMPDNKTLLSVFRLTDGKNLWQAISTDQGYTWGPASEINAWSVFPQLRALPSGALVLSSGRPGIGLWLADGRSAGSAPDPLSWKFYNLARQHNTLMNATRLGGGGADLLYPAPELAVANASSRASHPVMTKAYTGLETMGCDQGACTLVVSYDRLSNGNAGPDPPGPHGPADAAFTMRVTVVQA